MLKIKPLLLIVSLILFHLFSFGQCPFNTKFGKIKPEDFKVQSPLIDSSTRAVILFDVGDCSFEGNLNGWFSIKYTKHTRIKILNKNGYDAAIIKEPLYVGDHNREEKMDDIKASTFNLVNNIVEETKLNKADIMTSKYNRNFSSKVFTLPALKEGSIIEFTYTIHSEYTRYLRPWKFESEYPCLYNEYAVAIPEIFNYVCDLRENVPLKVTHNDYFDSYMISRDEGKAASSIQTFSVRAGVRQTKWVANDIPQVKEEPLLRTIDNCISKVDFFLKEIRVPDQPVDTRYNSWEKVCENLRKDESFGEQIYANHHWLNEPLKVLTANISDTVATIKKVFEYVRNNFAVTKEEGIYLSEKTTLKDVFNNRKGSAAELNMLLVAMLRKLNFNAEPTILSTRSNGVAHPFYPILSEYDYLIVCAKVGETKYFMDASEPYLGFNKLPLKCYNGYARILSENPYPYLFSSDSIKEKENVFVLISSDDKSITANFQQDLGYYNSQKYRSLFGKKSVKEIGDVLKKEFSTDAIISDLVVDSLNSLENPLKLSYTSSINFNGDVIYINPLFNYAINENPFKSDKRKYPVEKPFALNLLYVMSFNIPPGYKVDEMPKSVKAKLNEDEGYFEYLISVTDDLIQMRCKLNFEKANYKAEDYQSIRDFYSIVVKKMNEEIVLKKIK